MLIRALRFGAAECAVATEPVTTPPASGWVWIDVTAGPEDMDSLAALTGGLGLDALAVRDTVEDTDLPKVDDFGSSVHVVLHGLADTEIATFEIGCFLSEACLVTIHEEPSPSIDVLWDGVQVRPALAGGGADVTLARLADVATRRLVSVLDAFDDRNEELIGSALSADADFLAEITAVRADLAALRRSVHPQREALDVLRRSTSRLISDPGRRRFSDVFDTAFMGLVAVVSLGTFVALGWTRRPSGRTAGALLGRGLAEAARSPAQLVGAVFEISTMPIRTVAGSVIRRPKLNDPH